MEPDPLSFRLNRMERRLWSAPEPMTGMEAVLQAQAEENARLIWLDQELTWQEMSLIRTEESLKELLGGRIWNTLSLLGSGMPLAAPVPVAAMEAFVPTRRLPVTVIAWQASPELLASCEGASTVLRADDPASLQEALCTPYEHLVVLVHGAGRLHPEALATLVDVAAADQDADLFYADDDWPSPTGLGRVPFYKPDWSPDLLLSQDYLSGVLAFSPTRSRQLETPTCPYDAALKLSREASRIVHIPRVLFHHARSVASEVEKAALERHIPRGARVESGVAPGRWRVRYPLPADRRVRIVIPSGGQAGVLQDNLDALFHRTDYRDFQVVVVDNSPLDQPELPLPSVVRRLDFRGQPFNYSALNNAAVRDCDVPYVLFLNDDTQALIPGWLDAMLELAARPEVGAVGAKLLYPDRRIQHAGIVMGLFDNCGHAFRTLPGDERHYFDLPDVIRNVSAVTAACLMTRSAVFWEAGGFDEVNFPVAYNDVDLCLRIGAAGYRVLYTPYAVLRHHEAYSKPAQLQEAGTAEREALQRRYPALTRQDPFYNPNLPRWREDYALG